MTPYTLKGQKLNGKFVGTLEYGPDQVADSKDESADGFKSEKDLNEWANRAAQGHKLSIQPQETYKVQRTFSV